MSNQVSNVELTEAVSNQTNGQSIFENPLELVQDLEIKLHSPLGEADISVRELMELKQGSVVSLNTQLNQPLSLYLKDKLIAKGHLVAVGNSYGIEIIEIA